MATFDFARPIGDARMAELELLSWADRNGILLVPELEENAWLDLVISLVFDNLVTAFDYQESRRGFSNKGLGSSPQMTSSSGIPGESLLERGIVIARVDALDGLYGHRPGRFKITHRGRVRLSELKQDLRARRQREAFGILWDSRHWEPDLRVALLEASPYLPVLIAYLDMNGLKHLNDTFGHDTGDRALRAYFEAVATALKGSGDAYRLGGDEVLVILPGASLGDGVRTIENASTLLMGEGRTMDAQLSIAAGVLCIGAAGRDAAAVRSQADQPSVDGANPAIKRHRKTGHSAERIEAA